MSSKVEQQTNDTSNSMCAFNMITSFSLHLCLLKYFKNDICGRFQVFDLEWVN